ncbi:MAG TPA: hypothetical protein VNL15_02590 [Dehalococcoidia bacterium]|nr:hypothetical protein [Dehalococcoidia bacterium]
MRRTTLTILGLGLLTLLTFGFVSTAGGEQSGATSGPGQPLGTVEQSRFAPLQGCYWTSTTVVYDPLGVAPSMGMPDALFLCLQVSLPAASDISPMTLTGPEPWADVTGTLVAGDYNVSSFTGTGEGPLPGFPRVAAQADGKFFFETAYTLKGAYQIGVNGELPGGNPIMYALLGRQLRHADLDCDGQIALADAIAAQRQLAGVEAQQNEPCPDFGQEVASFWGDVDCNGQANLLDIIKIMEYVAGKTPQQAPGCPAFGALVTVA